MKKLVGRTDIEDALDRLDRLTQDEVRMVAAQGLKATHSVDEKVQAVCDTVHAVDNKIQTRTVEDKVPVVDDKVQGVDDRIRDVGDKVDLIIGGVQFYFRPVTHTSLSSI